MVNSGEVSWQGMDWDNGSRLRGSPKRLRQRELQVEKMEEHSSHPTRLACKQDTFALEGYYSTFSLLSSWPDSKRAFHLQIRRQKLGCSG